MHCTTVKIHLSIYFERPLPKNEENTEKNMLYSEHMVFASVFNIINILWESIIRFQYTRCQMKHVLTCAIHIFISALVYVFLHLAIVNVTSNRYH